jgi:hypothetical protein
LTRNVPALLPRIAAALLCTVAAAAPAGAADAAAALAAVDPTAAQGPRDARDIYAQMLENRFQSFTQEARMESGDRGGRIQETRFRMHWKDFSALPDEAARGVLSKTLVKYSHPFDVRHSGYLVIQNEGRINDQFVYMPARRAVVRVNLRGEAVFGSDFSFEDVIPRELDDATYTRLEDESVGDRPVFVIDATPTAQADSDYSRFLVYIDVDRFVVLRTRYWDRAGVEVKELRANTGTVRQIEDVWVPMELTMRNLPRESYTRLEIAELVPNPDLPSALFHLRHLEAH